MTAVNTFVVLKIYCPVGLQTSVLTKVKVDVCSEKQYKALTIQFKLLGKAIKSKASFRSLGRSVATS